MSWESVSVKRASALRARLLKEVGDGHLLRDRLECLEVLSARSDCDDVLVLDTKTREAFVVHLTWSESDTPSRDPRWPSTTAIAESDKEKILRAVALETPYLH